MKPRMSLSKKIVLLAITNFAFIGLVFAAFIYLQLQQDVQTTLLAPARDRVGSMARELAVELQQNDPDDFDTVIQRRSKESGMNLYLFLNEGRQVAGPPIALPPEIELELRRLPPALRPPSPPGKPEESRGEVRILNSAGRENRAQAPLGAALAVYFQWAKGDIPYWIGARMPVPVGGEAGIRPGTLFVGFSSLWDIPFLAQMWTWMAAVAVAAIFSILLWIPLVRGLTRTIDQMMHATATIADGNFDVKLDQKRGDELGLLAIAITRMASRLETFVKGQKRFLGDVAHELRSPLGRMRVASEILERRAEPEAVRYVEDMKEDVELMAGLTDQLLAFAKAELRPDAVSLVPTKVADVVQRVIKVEAGEADVRVDVSPELHAMAEPEYLFRSVSNLVRNSLRYAAGAGPIEISASANDRDVLITVADSGPGVPEDALEKIFEPFYRLDSSRQRKTGGTGLGLAIVRTCIEACHGSIECRNRKPSGLMVTLRLARAA